LLKIIIPVGISFYVFRTISYVVDVYNEKVECVQKISDYLVYMTFFPLMISGPITRAEQFIPQINQKEGVSREKINSGIYYIIKGIVKKAIFADYLSVYVAMIFAAPKGYSGIENLVGIVCFTIQLYLDFSGYTDIATGISKIIGFEIGANFNEPFKAKSVSEFWRRWHISLSDWLKDYIFSPLNFYFRKMKVFGAILAMFITFFICGIVLSWELATRNFFSFKAKGFLTFVMSPILWILTFSFLVVSMMAMKVESVETAWGFISKLWTDTGFQNARLFFEVQLAFTSMFLIAILLVFSPTKLKNKFQLMFIKSHVSVKICIMLLLVQIMIELQNQNIVPFIYAQY
jgi:D-alanyl-lipoteichoic acid acyltransferase DltB (MBOAT superfamily)